MILLNVILIIHTRSIDEFGGAYGIRDIEALHSGIERPFQTFDGIELYPEVLQKAAALLESILINHPFIDGNKRTAYTITRYFLRQNNLDINASENEVYNFIIEVASGKRKFEDIFEWLKVNSFTKTT